ncbi:MAG: copper transporter [Caldicoprobacterales bacterium]|jgi:hypothetical protein
MTGIFFSLGLGMIIGIVLEDNNIIENQQTILIQQIEEQFYKLRTETEKLKIERDLLLDQSNQLKKLGNYLVYKLLHKRLDGIRVGIISFSPHSSIIELLNFLRFTGAEIQSAVTILPTLSLDDKIITNQYHQHDEFTLKIIEEILHGMKSAYITPLIQEAEDIMIYYHHKEYEYPVDIIILLCQGDVSLVYNYILLKQAKNAEIPIIVVESEELSDRLAKYERFDVPVIDNIKSLYGQLAFVSILEGDAQEYDLNENELKQLLNISLSELESDVISLTNGKE